MVRTGQSPRHEALRAFLVERRDKAGLSQTERCQAVTSFAVLRQLMWKPARSWWMSSR